MKASLLVKVASQTAEFYQDAQKLMTRDVVKGIWEKVKFYYIVIHLVK